MKTLVQLIILNALMLTSAAAKQLCFQQHLELKKDIKVLSYQHWNKQLGGNKEFCTLHAKTPASAKDEQVVIERTCYDIFEKSDGPNKISSRIKNDVFPLTIICSKEDEETSSFEDFKNLLLKHGIEVKQ